MVGKGLCVSCSAVSIISTEKKQQCSTGETQPAFVYVQMRLRVSGLFFVKSIINDGSRKRDMITVVTRVKQQTRSCLLI